MDYLVIGLGIFGRSVAKNLKQQGGSIVGVDNDEKSLQAAEEYLDEALKLDASIEANLRQIGVEHFQHCFVCIGSNMETNLLTTLNLNNLGAAKITSRSNSLAHSSLLQKIGSVGITAPEAEIARQLVKEVMTDVENYIRIRDDMVILTIPTPALMVHKNLRELSLRHQYRVQILWMDKFVPYVDGQGNEGTYEEGVDFIPVDYRFNSFDRISVFGDIQDIQVFVQSMSKGSSQGSKIVLDDANSVSPAE